MKIRFIAVSIITVIVITSVFVFTRNTGVSKEQLFSEEEIAYENIESIEVIEYKTNNHTVSNDKDFIKRVSSTLENLKLDNITTSTDINEDPLYVIYIRNVGYYPGGGIGIYKHQLEYKGRNQTILPEESSTLIKLLEDETQGEKQ